LVQLKDQDFDLAKAGVGIADPLYNLHLGAIYQAFSLLKVAAQDAKQQFTPVAPLSLAGLEAVTAA
jgi:hypothetical protein